MGGGGARIEPKDIERGLQKAKDKVRDSDYKSKLADLLGDVLQTVNDRNTAEIQERLDELSKHIDLPLDDEKTLRFGGSVKKHTYVDGLSDVDVLLTLDPDRLNASDPQAVLTSIGDAIRNSNIEHESLKIGRMAVTIEYPNGLEIQVLPAIRSNGSTSIPDSSGKGWSDINPEGFTRKLTATNEACAGRLVPTIKVVKSINSSFPESARLSGYHLEAMAIEAFKGYQGEPTTPKMLEHFFSRASSIVKRPIKDSTGQSIHVDEYLGKANSRERKTVAKLMDRVSRRIETANEIGDIGAWEDLLF